MRKVRFAMEGERDPSKPPLERFKAMTLWLGLQVTPLHLQKLMELFHEIMRPFGSSLILDLIASNATRSPTQVVQFCAAVMTVGNAVMVIKVTKRNRGVWPIKNGSRLALIFGSCGNGY